MTRTLHVGDRLGSFPCSVRVVSIDGTTAWAYCIPCGCQHALDVPLYESGGGPWLPRAIGEAA